MNVPGVVTQAIRWGVALIMGVCLMGNAKAASPRGSDLLPDSTRQYLSIPNVAALAASYRKTELARLFADPVLAVTVKQIARAGVDGLDLGMDWGELEKLAAGEVGWAVFQPDNTQASKVFFVDVTGKDGKTVAAPLVARLKGRGYTMSQEKVAGVVVDCAVTVGKKRYLAAKEGFLLCTDNLAGMTMLLKRWPGEKQGSLSGHKPYQRVFELASAQTKTPLEAFDYTTPLELAKTRRMLSEMKVKGVDVMATYEDLGFGSIEAIGSGVCFAPGSFELTYHVAVLAPGQRKGALGMIKLTPGKEFAPPAWIPGDLASFSTTGLDIGHAFSKAGPVFDSLFGQGSKKGTFEAVIKKLKDQPNGPRVDVRKDLVENLVNRMIVVTDNDLKLGPHAVRSLVAIPTRDTDKVRECIDRVMMDLERYAKEAEFRKVKYWEVKRRNAVAEPSAFICVTQGHLLLGNNPDFLQRFLTRGSVRLTDEKAYQRVRDALGKFAPGECAMQGYTRPDLDYRVAYNALRSNKLAESKSIYALLLAQMVGNGKNAFLDAKKLPEFEKLVPYLGPSGITLTPTKDGWVINGFSLKK